MVSNSGLDSCKALLEVLADLIPGGVLFGLIEGDTIVWNKGSESFKVNVLSVGAKLDYNSTTMQAMRERKVLTQKIPGNVYGVRLTVTSIPIVNDKNEATGAFSVAIPRLHPVIDAFGGFAPFMVEMFHEGAFLYTTDLEKVVTRQKSTRFDMPMLEIGYALKDTDAAKAAMRAKKPSFLEFDASRFGVPIAVASYPLFDEDDAKEVVGSMGLVTPKITAAKMREMANNLDNGLTAISAAIQQLTASATQIHTNEQELNENIGAIVGLSDEINQVAVFIREIADETKMLGLNAAIEAARAGEAGRGFGVVAEEIRKLSSQSKSTVPKINKLTDDIKELVDSAGKKSSSSLHSSQEQAAASEEVTASIEEITALADELNKMAQRF